MLALGRVLLRKGKDQRSAIGRIALKNFPWLNCKVRCVRCGCAKFRTLVMFHGGICMGEVVAKRKSWARIRLENGDQVMISIAQSGVKVFKMRLAGILPGPTLWQSKSIADVVETFFDTEKPPPQQPIDPMIDKIIDCHSSAEVVMRLMRQMS